MEIWVQDSGVNHICKLVSNKMESAKPLLKMKLKTVSPEYVKQWDVTMIMDPVATITPTWTKILYAASEPQRSKSKDTRNWLTVWVSASKWVIFDELMVICWTRNIISASVHYLCSLASCKVQIGLGLLTETTGASHGMIDVLHQSALLMSLISITHIIDALAEHSLEEVQKAVQIRPHTLTYDNINLSMSIFVEQTANTPNKVQSSTFLVIYELLNAKLEDMKLEPIISCSKTHLHSKSLTFNHLKNLLNPLLLNRYPGM